MAVNKWTEGGWSAYDAFMNNNRNCGNGWEYNRDVEEVIDREDNKCEKCGSMNTRWQHYEDCIDRDHVGTESECLDCGYVYIF